MDPPNLHKCQYFGHLDSQCPAKEAWVPKNPVSADSSHVPGHEAVNAERDKETCVDTASEDSE